MCTANFICNLNNTALVIALPHLVRYFHASSVAASWILLSFMLTNTALMITFGRLSDMFGRNRMCVVGLSIYTLASLLLGLSPSVGFLIGMRVVQAVGVAMLLSNGAAVVASVTPRNRLSQAMGLYMAGGAVSQLVGPTVGGLLADTIGWRWLFWFNVPLGVAIVIWCALVLKPTPRSGERERFDILGNILIPVALGGLLIGLSTAQDAGWSSPIVIGGFAVFAALLPLFLRVESRHPSPVVDLKLFRGRLYSLANLAALLNSMGNFGMVLLVGLYFQAAVGDGAFVAGLKAMPLPVASVVASATIGILLRWLDQRAVALIGCTAVVCGVVLMFFALDGGSDYGMVALGLVVCGWGGGTFLPANTATIVGAAPANRLGVVNAVRLMLQTSGSAFSAALSLTLLTTPLQPDLRQAVYAGRVSEVGAGAVTDLVAGYRLAISAMLVVAVGSLATCALSYRYVLGQRADARAEEARTEEARAEEARTEEARAESARPLEARAEGSAGD